MATKSNGMSQLLTGAKKKAQEISSIKSIADPEQTSVPVIEKTPEVVGPEKELQQEQEVIKTENVILPEKKGKGRGIEFLFENRKVEKLEVTRIPTELHKKLKLLSLASGTSVTAMMSNILYDFFEENGKEVNNYIKKIL